MSETTSSATGQTPGADVSQTAGLTPAGSTAQTGHEATPQAGLTPDQHATEPDGSGGRQTPKPFDEEYVRNLRSEAAAARKELQQLKDRDLTEQQRIERERDELKTELSPLKLENLRFKAAARNGLPLELASRLSGSTDEELDADAEELKRQFNVGAQTAPVDFDAGVRPGNGGSSAGDFNALIRAAARR